MISDNPEAKNLIKLKEREADGRTDWKVLKFHYKEMEEDITNHGIRRFRKSSKETKDTNINIHVDERKAKRKASEQRKRRGYRKEYQHLRQRKIEV